MHLSEHIQLKPWEKVEYFLRRHWLVFFSDIMVVVVLSLIPVAAYFILQYAVPGLIDGPVSRPLLILLGSAYYLTIWLVFLTKFVDYYLDAWIVTNHRIVNIEQRGLFSRTISELDLAKVQDVTSEVKGIIPSVLNFGSVFVQTAGEVERFVFEEVPFPHEIRKRILDLIEDDRVRHQTSKEAIV
jgi:hypothetical protein